MTVSTPPLSELNREGHAALVRALGVSGTARFLSQFTHGTGDYTREREGFVGDEPLDTLYEQVKEADRQRGS
jgi:hypothetical protein